MHRLSGIGVSPGVVSGRAVDSQSARAGAPLSRAGGAHRARTGPPRAGPRPGRRPAARNPGQRRRAPRTRARLDLRCAAADARRSDAGAARRTSRPREAGQRRVGDPAGVRGVQRGVRRDRRPLPARAQGRRRRPGRPHQDEHPPGRGHASRSAARGRRGVGAHRRRADAVARSPGGLDQGPRLRHRRRQPHLSHRHPGPFARSAGGRRVARRESTRATGTDGRHRRHRQRSHPRSRRRAAHAGGAQRRRHPAVRHRRSRAFAAGDDGRWRPHQAGRQHRVPGRPGRGPLCRRRRHRALSIRVPADRRQHRRRRGCAVRDLSRHARGHGAVAGDGAHVRRRRRPARDHGPQVPPSPAAGLPTRSAAAARVCVDCV